ncbi:MAG: DUF692 domain-containing protein [Arenimonas sp.]
MNTLPRSFSGGYLPANAGPCEWAGIGFKPQHFELLILDRQLPDFVEVHAENYMGEGGRPHAQLMQIRERTNLSIHGVGLSIGSETGLDPRHLDRLALLISRYQPMVFSEHLAWSTHDGRFFNDLLPLCYDRETLNRVCEHIDTVQSHLGIRMLLENPSTYLEYETSTFSECDFISEIVKRTGCGLLLDVNNVYVSCENNGHDAKAYIDGLPIQSVAEIHLAGHAEDRSMADTILLIDNHGSPVAASVWDLYDYLLDRSGPVATLIEWDSNIPSYHELCHEMQMAKSRLQTSAKKMQGIAA